VSEAAVDGGEIIPETGGRVATADARAVTADDALTGRGRGLLLVAGGAVAGPSSRFRFPTPRAGRTWMSGSLPLPFSCAGTGAGVPTSATSSHSAFFRQMLAARAASSSGQLRGMPMARAPIGVLGPARALIDALGPARALADFAGPGRPRGLPGALRRGAFGAG
jgi:hypothetical protein